MSEIHGFDVIGLPYYEYMNTDEDLLIFRCGKHGEYAYMTIGEQAKLAEQWEKLLTVGEKYLMQTGGWIIKKSYASKIHAGMPACGKVRQ